MSLSFSRLSTFEQCPRKFRLRYIDQAPEQPQGALIGGRVLHRAMELGEQRRLWQEDEIGHDTLASIFNREFSTELIAVDQSMIRWGGRKTKQYPQGEDEQWWRFMGPVMLKRWAYLRRHDEREGITIARDAVEIEVGMPIGDTTVRGYIDALPLILPTGFPLVRDYKSGTSIGDPFQLATYARIWHAMSGIPVERGQLVKLRADERRKQIIDVDLRPMLPLVDLLYGETLRALQIAEREDSWPIKRGMFCKSCPVRAHCPWGSTLDDVPGED
jgi:putative RecB family exonuclease